MALLNTIGVTNEGVNIKPKRAPSPFNKNRKF